MLTRRGDSLLSCARDRSLRLWRRTDEQVFVEEERENELEQLFEAGLERQQPNPDEEAEAEALGLGGGGGGEATGAGRRSIESVKGAERVLEALRVLREEAARRAEHEAAVRQWESRGRAAALLGGDTQAAEPGKRPALVVNLLLQHGHLVITPLAVPQLARPLCLLRARLAAPGSPALSEKERGPATGHAATASVAPASGLKSCRLHRV